MTTPGQVWIIGAGGHAKVVIESAREAGFEVVGLADPRPQLHGTAVLGAPVIGDVSAVPSQAACVVAIGDSRVRARVVDELADRVKWVSVVHPRSVVSAHASVGVGSVVFAMAVVHPGSTVGDHVIVNTSAVVEHDNSLASFSQLATGAKLTGGVTIEAGAFIGAGAIVLPGVRVGAWSIVGAGAVVTRDVDAGATVVGVPAREMHDAKRST